MHLLEKKQNKTYQNIIYQTFIFRLYVSFWGVYFSDIEAIGAKKLRQPGNNTILQRPTWWCFII